MVMQLLVNTATLNDGLRLYLKERVNDQLPALNHSYRNEPSALKKIE